MVQQANNSSHKYISFISYKHEDKKIAKWLKRKLESYRLPSKLCKQYNNIPRRLTQLGSIYLDKENLRPGAIEKNLHADMAEAKYLIVICSRATCNEPKYINQEIEIFLEAGHTMDQIIPFIVDDDEKPEQTCFPSMLEKLNETNDLIGVNIHDAGNYRAFLKVVARLLNIQVTELESANDRRQRKNKIMAACSSVILLIAGYFSYDYFIPKYTYYADYTEVYGIPKGIEELTTAQIAQMDAHYTIKMQYHKVQELRHENSAGKLVEHSKEHIDRPTKAVYSYMNDGTLKAVIYQDVEECDSTTLTYVNINTIDLQNSNNSTSSNNEIHRYIIFYDEHGYTLWKLYAKNTYNAPVADENHVWGIAYDRDAQGRSVGEHLLVYTGAGNIVKGAADQNNYAFMQ